MQYYTKQQLQGASRYYGKCRIGNWNEDVELEEVRYVNQNTHARHATLLNCTVLL